MGRIGRAALKVILDTPNLELVGKRYRFCKLYRLNMILFMGYEKEVTFDDKNL
jgi:hypothetical protein